MNFQLLTNLFLFTLLFCYGFLCSDFPDCVDWEESLLPSLTNEMLDHVGHEHKPWETHRWNDEEPEPQDFPITTPLHDAVKSGNLENVRSLFEKLSETHLNVDVADKLERRATHLAASTGNLKILKYLVEEKSAKPFSVYTRFGHSVLQYAICKCQTHIVQYLLDLGKLSQNQELLKVELDRPDMMGFTPLIHGLRQKCKEIVTNLMKYNVSLSSSIPDVLPPLHYAVSSRNSELVSELLKSEPNIHFVSEDFHGSQTALELAAYNGLTDIVSLLLKAGGNPNRGDLEGMNAFHMAAEEGHPKVLEILLEHDPSLLDSTDHHGWTALHHAARYGQESTVEFLLKKGAQIKGASQERNSGGLFSYLLQLFSTGTTPQDLASQYGHTRIAGVIFRHLETVNKKSEL